MEHGNMPDIDWKSIRIDKLEEENKRLRESIVEYINAAEEVDDLVRELDEIINGDDAAEQASLCDLVAQLRSGEE